MGRYLAQRLLMIIPVMLGVTLLVFAMMHLAPGDPAVAMAGPRATPEQLTIIRHYLGLDRPLPTQYALWLERAAVGDLGRSIRQGVPVTSLVLVDFRNSALLAGVSFTLATVLGIMAGLVAGLNRGSILDQVIGFVSALGFSTPAFFLGLLLIVLFAYKFPILPIGGMHSVQGSSGLLDVARHLVLPAITLAAVPTTVIARTVRSSVLEILGQDYIRTARAKGLREKMVISRHILKNTLIPVITLLGLQAGFLLGGAAIVEVVFSYPGVGNLMIQSILERDLPVTQGCVLVLALVYVFVNLGADVLQCYLDPRIHFG